MVSHMFHIFCVDPPQSAHALFYDVIFFHIFPYFSHMTFIFRRGGSATNPQSVLVIQLYNIPMFAVQTLLFDEIITCPARTCGWSCANQRWLRAGPFRPGDREKVNNGQ